MVLQIELKPDRIARMGLSKDEQYCEIVWRDDHGHQTVRIPERIVQAFGEVC